MLYLIERIINMKINLDPSEKKLIIDALKMARVSAIMNLDYSTKEAAEESEQFQEEIDRRYDGLIDRLSKSK